MLAKDRLAFALGNQIIPKYKTMSNVPILKHNSYNCGCHKTRNRTSNQCFNA